MLIKNISSSFLKIAKLASLLISIVPTKLSILKEVAGFLVIAKIASFFESPFLIAIAQEMFKYCTGRAGASVQIEMFAFFWLKIHAAFSLKFLSSNLTNDDDNKPELSNITKAYLFYENSDNDEK